MSLVKFRAQNHPQQVGAVGAKDNVDDRGTDPELFAELDSRFGFTIDVAAAAHNAKCDRYYDLESDGLVQSWASERVWCNPPYSSIEPWVRKAWSEWEAFDPETGPWGPGPEVTVMLLPANRTEQGWWQDHVEPFRDRPGSALRVEFLRGRRRFVRANSTEIGPNERPPFGVCVYSHGRHGDVRTFGTTGLVRVDDLGCEDCCGRPAPMGCADGGSFATRKTPGFGKR